MLLSLKRKDLSMATTLPAHVDSALLQSHDERVGVSHLAYQTDSAPHVRCPHPNSCEATATCLNKAEVAIYKGPLQAWELDKDICDLVSDANALQVAVALSYPMWRRSTK